MILRRRKIHLDTFEVYFKQEGGAIWAEFSMAGRHPDGPPPAHLGQVRFNMESPTQMAAARLLASLLIPNLDPPEGDPVAFAFEASEGASRAFRDTKGEDHA